MVSRQRNSSAICKVRQPLIYLNSCWSLKKKQALALAAFQSQPPVFVWFGVFLSVTLWVEAVRQPRRFTANRLAAVFSLTQLDMGSGGFQKPWSWAVSIQMAIIVWGPPMSLNKETQTMFLTGNRLFTENKWAWRCVTTQFSRQIGYELSCPRWRQVRRPISWIGFI